MKITEDICKQKPLFWFNNNNNTNNTFDRRSLNLAAMNWDKFKPLLKALFSEIEHFTGEISSEITHLKELEKYMCNEFGLKGELWLKRDDTLPIAGSIKARGGIYEVLVYAEILANKEGFLQKGMNIDQLASKKAKDFFSNYEITVGSTGNLGLSIGIIASRLGFQTTVHMSADAKKWKKDLLSAIGVNVKEHLGNYTEAVENGREEAKVNHKSYFIDDEKSAELFFGYSTAAAELQKQLLLFKKNINESHPLLVYLPCGVGGGPGGIIYGLKALWNDHVYCFYGETTPAPCMFLALATRKGAKISIDDIGLDGKTIADGLAVNRASQLVFEKTKNIVDGAYTVRDEEVFSYLQLLYKLEKIPLEPSALTGLVGVEHLLKCKRIPSKIERAINKKGAMHLAWSTGGSLVPTKIWQDMYNNPK